MNLHAFKAFAAFAVQKGKALKADLKAAWKAAWKARLRGLPKISLRSRSKSSLIKASQALQDLHAEALPQLFQ